MSEESAHKNLEGTISPDHDRSPCTPQLVSSRVALAGAALGKALGAAGLRVLERDKAFAIIITVPTPGWIDAIWECVEALSKVPVTVIHSSRKAKDRESDGLQASVTLARGNAVVAISHTPNTIPEVLIAAATHRFDIPPINPGIVAEAMKRCQVGRTPGALRKMDLSTLDFDALCACLPRGASKAEGVRRLRHALEIRAVPSASKGLALPRLEDAIEYGEAREWGLNLKQDIADVGNNVLGWRDVDRGAILEGPPGSGKTTFAKILGIACGVPTIVGSVSELFASSAGNLDSVIKAQRALFAEASAAAPVILFLDEINAFPDPATMDSRGRDWWLPVVYDFYLLLDSAVSARDGIIVVGATNLIQNVSPALLRHGRLERSIHIGTPTVEGLANILRTHLTGELRDEDLLPLAKAGLGATAADAMDWVRSARRSSRRAGRPLSAIDLMEQIAPVDTRSESDRYRAAVHEAGHGVVGLVLGEPLREISVVPRGPSGGRAIFDDLKEVQFDRTRIERHVVMILGGSAAEAEIFGSASSGAGGSPESDLARASMLMATMRASYGLANTLLWAAPDDAAKLLRVDPLFRQAVEGDLQRLYAEARRLAHQYRERILAVADLLAKESEVSRDQVAQLVLSKAP